MMSMRFEEFVELSKEIEREYKISPEVYEHFQKFSKDFNPLHTDVAFAQKKGFPGLVMYGNILNGFISHFVGMELPCADVMIQAQDIQFRKPVYMNDILLLKSEIQEYSEAVQVVIYKLKIYRQTSEKPVLVATGHVQVGFLNDKVDL